MAVKKVLKRFKRVKINRRSVVVFAIVVMGATFLVSSRAATFSVGFEAENGTKTGVATITDSLASAGSATQFGTATGSDPLGVSKKCSQLTNLKFCDDFDGAVGSYPDNAKWNVFQSGSSWGSHCWKKSPDNISMDGQGSLKMSMFDTGSVLCTDYYGKPSKIASAGMDTGGGRFVTNQGKFEIRAKLSCATGVWGSIWTSGATAPWPTQGEIDIWETMDGNLKRIKHTVHAGADSGSGYWKDGGYYLLPSGERFCDNFHVYAIEWRNGYIQFMVDGVNSWRINKSDTPSGKLWPFDTGQHRILITFQYGAVDPPRGLLSSNDLPTSMLIDYVRVYN